LLEVDLPESTPVDAQSMQDARQILENRSNGLGVSEVIFQVAGERRIVGEFPGLTNTDEVIAVLKETGQLEFVDLGSTYLPEGTVIKTDYGNSSDDGSATATPEATATLEATAEATLAAAAEGEAQPTVEATATTPEETIWHTIMTGDQLSAVAVTTDQLGNYVVQFELKPDGKETFADYTTNNVGKYLAIVLDKQVVSAPTIDTPVTEGSGIIRGNFTYDSANALAIQLRYGSLPIPLKVVESRVIGPTLGQDSLNKSLLAGIIGFALVTLFMIIYYRLPGVVAILAIINYALVTLALFKLIPVTLTLPGIAGFLLSTGGALDANILMFERLKEELHQGRNLKQAVELSWKRAWPSIRDSNIATIITSIILFWFGSQYGATIVKGFALTLALGVGVSLFNAVMVTRTLLTLTLDFVDPVKHLKWFGA
jgi:preprotein translocase subunit SecD